MLDWIRRLITPAPPLRPPDPPDPQAALESLRALSSDARVEEVWDALDACVEEVRGPVEALVRDELLGEYPRHAAVLWLAHLDGNAGRRAPSWLAEQLEASVVWALGFDENQVLIGGALGGLDALEPAAREVLARSAFEALGEASARRYWLLLKVRSRPFLGDVVVALGELDPQHRPKMAGAFRQFTAADVGALLDVYEPEHPSAPFLLQALAATSSPAARPVLEAAAARRDDRSDRALVGAIVDGQGDEDGEEEG